MIKEYSIADIRTNLSRNWRYMLLVFAGCIAIGIISGVITCKKLEHIDYSVDDSIIKSIDISDLKKDEEYFYNAYRRVQKQRNMLNVYIQYLKLVRMGGDSLEAVSLFEERIMEYEQSYIAFEEEYIYQTPIIETDKSEEWILQWIARREQDRDAEVYANPPTDADLWRQKTLKKELQFWERMRTNYMKRSSQERQFVCAEMEEQLADVIDIYNDATETFNQLVKLLEEQERYDIVYSRYLWEEYHAGMFATEEMFVENVVSSKIQEAMLYARSIPMIDDKNEAFLAYIVFFSLFGATLSLTIGAFWKRST